MGFNSVFKGLNMKGRYSLEVCCIDARIILEWMLGNEVGTMWTGYV